MAAPIIPSAAPAPVAPVPPVLSMAEEMEQEEEFEEAIRNGFDPAADIAQLAEQALAQMRERAEEHAGAVKEGVAAARQNLAGAQISNAEGIAVAQQRVQDITEGLKNLTKETAQIKTIQKDHGKFLQNLKDRVDELRKYLDDKKREEKRTRHSFTFQSEFEKAGQQLSQQAANKKGT